MKRAIFIGTLILLAAASCKNDSAKAVKNVSTSPGPVKVALSTATSQLAAEIAKYGEVHGSAVGIGGIMSAQYKRYLLLSDYASIDELVTLTDHASPTVRVYAFWALTSKNFIGLTTICRKHITDTAQVQSLRGCIMMQERVNNMMKSCMADRSVRQQN